MPTFIIILIVLVSVLLALIVLVQNPKGGGLASGFSGGANLMGVQRTGDFLEKGTWGLAVGLMVLCLAINILGPSTGTSGGGLSDQIEAPVQNQGFDLQLDNTAPITAPAEAPAAGDTAGN